jgi:hypothetical protein
MQQIGNYIWIGTAGIFIALLITYFQIARLIARSKIFEIKKELFIIGIHINEVNHALLSFDFSPQEHMELQGTISRLKETVNSLEIRKLALEDKISSKRARSHFYTYAITKGVWQHIKYLRTKKEGGSQ